MKNPVSISVQDDISKWEEENEKSEKNAILRHALAHNGFNGVFQSADQMADSQFAFSTEIKTLPVTNQKKSGRCWIFSASNLLRELIAKKAGISDMFEISQNYIAFYDKLEKINFTLEALIDLIDKKPDDRKEMFILQNGVGDGGQWDMFVDIVKKYGVCPKAAMVETAQSNETHDSNVLINSSLRRFAYEAHLLMKEGKGLKEVRELKAKYMEKFYALVVSCFGLPPKSFDFEYTDKKGAYHIEKGYTPLSFFDKYVGKEIDEYVSIINAPTADKPYYQTFNIEYLGNVVGGKEVTHLNLPLSRFKELIVNQLKAGDLVWFGSDVSKYGVRAEGLWDDKCYDFSSAFGLSNDFAKDGMLDYFQSAMNHAMVLTGFDEKEGKIIRWKVENSWGEDLGTKGYFVMSDTFFDKFVYQAAIKKSCLGEKELQALKTKPVLLAPWDPFGTLAD
jgi:bleomycin hydrolase